MTGWFVQNQCSMKTSKYDWHHLSPLTAMPISGQAAKIFWSEMCFQYYKFWIMEKWSHCEGQEMELQDRMDLESDNQILDTSHHTELDLFSQPENIFIEKI